MRDFSTAGFLTDGPRCLSGQAFIHLSLKGTGVIAAVAGAVKENPGLNGHFRAEVRLACCIAFRGFNFFGGRAFQTFVYQCAFGFGPLNKAERVDVQRLRSLRGQLALAVQGARLGEIHHRCGKGGYA